MADRNPRGTDVHMRLKDRKRLARLIEIQEVSKRAVARAAGWRSHTYLQRLLSGQARSCNAAPAARIAAFLNVSVDDLFLPDATSVAGQNGQRLATPPPAEPGITEAA